jgi:hypothetical protein
MECFNLGRNVSFFVNQDDSREKLDSRLVLNQDAQKIFEGPMFRQVVEQNGFSNEILGSQIANFLASTQKPSVIANLKLDEGKSIPIRPFIKNLDDISLEVRDRVPVEQVPVGGQVSTQTNVHNFKQSDEHDEEDSSNEIRSSIALSAKAKDSSHFERLNLDATDFHQRSGSGVLIQPESEDWFLVRQYMDDESFRGSSKELAKEYFWQPVKGSKGLDSESEEDDSNESS